MQSLRQSPTDPDFVQNPYPFYERARAAGPFFLWEDYNRVSTGSYAAVSALFRDRRLGREAPPGQEYPVPEHLKPFYAVEAHSMLELEPPRHTRLRGLVLRAFTSRRIQALQPEIVQLCHDLVDQLPEGEFDLLTHFGQRLPVIVISRLLGVPEEMSGDLLVWSNAMVGMYQAGRDRAREDAAVAATEAFVAFMRRYVDERRKTPRDDLITALIQAEEAGEKLSTDELITTCILLLNAGHEATVHSIGNGVKVLLETGVGPEALMPGQIDATIEEILRYDPPLHIFSRWAYDDIEIMGYTLPKGSQVQLLLAAANRDPAAFEDGGVFNPARPQKANTSFGAGIHFCVGAPLARLELQAALPVLFSRRPGLHLTQAPQYGDVYHFHGLEKLMVRSA